MEEKTTECVCTYEILSVPVLTVSVCCCMCLVWCHLNGLETVKDSKCCYKTSSESWSLKVDAACSVPLKVTLQLLCFSRLFIKVGLMSQYKLVLIIVKCFLSSDVNHSVDVTCSSSRPQKSSLTCPLISWSAWQTCGADQGPHWWMVSRGTSPRCYAPAVQGRHNIQTGEKQKTMKCDFKMNQGPNKNTMGPSSLTRLTGP